MTAVLMINAVFIRNITSSVFPFSHFSYYEGFTNILSSLHIGNLMSIVNTAEVAQSE